MPSPCQAGVSSVQAYVSLWIRTLKRGWRAPHRTGSRGCPLVQAGTGRGPECWSRPGTLRTQNSRLSWTCTAVPSSGPLALSGSGLLPGTCRAGRSAWQGQEETRHGSGIRAPAEGCGVPSFPPQSALCPQLPRATGYPRTTGCPALPFAPTRHRTHSRASTVSSLRRKLSTALENQSENSRFLLCPDRGTMLPIHSERWTQDQEPSPVHGRSARWSQSTKDLAPFQQDNCLVYLPAQRPPRLSNSASRAMRDRPIALQYPEELQRPPQTLVPFRTPRKGLWPPRQRTGWESNDRLPTDCFKGQPALSEYRHNYQYRSAAEWSCS